MGALPTPSVMPPTTGRGLVADWKFELLDQYLVLGWDSSDHDKNDERKGRGEV